MLSRGNHELKREAKVHLSELIPSVSDVKQTSLWMNVMIDMESSDHTN